LKSNDGSGERAKMSKKRRLKIDKILKDETLKEDEKMDLMGQLNNGGLQKRQKKSQINDFKDNDDFISGDRPMEHQM
jgi:hypothetical protein